MGTDLVQPSCFRRRLNKGEYPIFGMYTCFKANVLGLGGVGAWDDRLADIYLAGLVFAESVEWLIDQAAIGRATMNKGEVRFINLPALLHFPEEGGVLFASSNQQKAAGFAIESADEGQEFVRILVTEPIDKRKSAVGSGGVNEPAVRFIDDQKRGVFKDNRGLGIHEG